MSNWIAEATLDWPLTWLGQDASGTAPPYGPSGVATLVLDLEQGFKVRHSWITDVIKFRAGGEQRISRNDTDREAYAGSAYLSASAALTVRAQLARYAAIGSVFLLGLPHESLSFVGSGTVISVNPDVSVDWLKPGQRVVAVGRDANGDRTGTDAVVQSYVNGSVTLDVSVTGSELMPAVPIYLEPQQSIPRYRTAVETWQLQARRAVPMDFAPTLASLDLGTMHASLAGNTITSRLFGLEGNGVSVRLLTDAGNPAAGTLDESIDNTIIINALGGTTTMADVATLLESSSYGILTEYDADYVIQDADAFIGGVMSGGSASGDVGTGATLTTYASHPVWTERLANPGQIEDGAHAMTQIIDHGGAPYSIGTADQADWFRTVAIDAGDHETWQWFKKFMAQVFGRQKKFWLATWRDDLEYSSHSGTSLTVDSDVGDFTAWWPSQRQHVQIEQGETVTYAEVTAATDNGDGTRTLTLSVSLAAGDVTRISWLELCRWEDADTYETTHTAEGFAVSMIARVVP